MPFTDDPILLDRFKHLTDKEESARVSRAQGKRHAFTPGGTRFGFRDEYHCAICALTETNPIHD